MSPSLWELTETALVIARERAAEHAREDRLFADPFAAGLGGEGPRLDAFAPIMRGYVGLRTRVFDEGLLGAGCPQVVLLASGLDTRAFRLPWTPGTVVFELDVDELVDYREPRLDAAAPRCDRRVVRADLRGEWAEALLAAGFDAQVPTAWLAEGVLMYLTPEENAALVTAAARLSAPGSVLLAEHVPTAGARPPKSTADGHALDTTGASWRSTLDDPQPWLAEHGWAAEPIDTAALAARVGRPLPAVLDPRKVGAACAHLLRANLQPRGL